MSHRRAWWVVEPPANAVRLWIAHATVATAKRLARQLARTLRVKLTLTDRRPASAAAHTNPRKPRLERVTAREILAAIGAAGAPDFYALRSSQVSDLMEYADQYRYRAPRNASGSRGRYFYQHLLKVAGANNPKRRRRVVARRMGKGRARDRARLRARTKRKRARRRNPAASPALAQAVATFRRFHGFDPKTVTRVPATSRTVPATLAQLGELLEVTYRSNKFDRKTRDYVHRFGTPRPLLCTRPDGRGLFIVGGSYRNTARGIVG